MHLADRLAPNCCGFPIKTSSHRNSFAIQLKINLQTSFPPWLLRIAPNVLTSLPKIAFNACAGHAVLVVTIPKAVTTRAIPSLPPPISRQIPTALRPAHVPEGTVILSTTVPIASTHSIKHSPCPDTLTRALRVNHIPNPSRGNPAIRTAPRNPPLRAASAALALRFDPRRATSRIPRERAKAARRNLLPETHGGTPTRGSFPGNSQATGTRTDAYDAPPPIRTPLRIGRYSPLASGFAMGTPPRTTPHVLYAGDLHHTNRQPVLDA